MKKGFSIFLNLLALGVFALALWRQVPNWIEASKAQGGLAAQAEVTSLENEKISLPPKDGKPSLLVFWATWCGPCRLELSRLNDEVKDNKIPSDRVIAISVGEDPDLVRGVARERGYKFRVAVDPTGSAGAAYKVAVTPTVYFLTGDGHVSHVSTGISPLFLVRARKVLGGAH